MKILSSFFFQIPIRVLSASEDILILDHSSATRIHHDDVTKPTITNPFASSSSSRPNAGTDDDVIGGEGDLDSGHMMLMNEGHLRKKATYYDIRASGGTRVGKLCLFKSSYKLGEDILGTTNLA